MGATNLAENLVGGFLVGGDAQSESQSQTAAKVNVDDEHTIDEVLIDTVHKHNRVESRTEHLHGKLQEMFGGNDTTPGGDDVGFHDFGAIAGNLANFLGGGDDQSSAAVQLQSSKPVQKAKARGSTDLSSLQQEIDALQQRVSELESSNRGLNAEVETLKKSKTSLAVESAKCIDELRGMLIQYQRHLNLRR